MSAHRDPRVEPRLRSRTTGHTAPIPHDAPLIHQGWECLRHPERGAPKSGNIPKEYVGRQKHEKVRPDGFEPPCKPLPYAEMLNEHGSEFNTPAALQAGK